MKTPAVSRRGPRSTQNTSSTSSSAYNENPGAVRPRGPNHYKLLRVQFSVERSASWRHRLAVALLTL